MQIALRVLAFNALDFEIKSFVTKIRRRRLMCIGVSDVLWVNRRLQLLYLEFSSFNLLSLSCQGECTMRYLTSTLI